MIQNVHNKPLKVDSGQIKNHTQHVDIIDVSDFLVINRAWKILENEKTRKRCLEIVAEATGMTDLAVTIKHFNQQSNLY